MKKGFTMIELIFVIVILGILAAVAIPKMAATRDDAKISSIATQVQSAVSEIPQYVTAHGGEANKSSLVKSSQVLKQLVDQKKAIKIGGNDRNISIKAGDTGCVRLEVNDTSLIVEGNTSNNTVICKGVKNRVKDANYTIAGSTVDF